jgi:hypothetical protein
MLCRQFVNSFIRGDVFHLFVDAVTRAKTMYALSICFILGGKHTS